MKSTSISWLLLIFLVGCATQTKPSTDLVEAKREILELQRIQGSQAAQIEELNHKILVLVESRTQDKAPPPVAPIVSEAPAETPVAPPDQMQVTTSPLVDKNSTGAERLYAQAVASAKKDQMSSLQKSVSLLLKGYKESPWTNNALFLLGEKLFEKGQYLKAAEQYETLYKNFPDGNKAVSALYQLGVCYQKLGKPNEAHEAFQNVVAVYPGSREASLAQKEISQSETEE